MSLPHYVCHMAASSWSLCPTSTFVARHFLLFLFYSSHMWFFLISWSSHCKPQPTTLAVTPMLRKKSSYFFCCLSFWIWVFLSWGKKITRVGQKLSHVSIVCAIGAKHCSIEGKDTTFFSAKETMSLMGQCHAIQLDFWKLNCEISPTFCLPQYMGKER